MPMVRVSNGGTSLKEVGHNVNYYCCLYRPDGTKIIYGKTPNSNVDGDYIRYHIAND